MEMQKVVVFVSAAVGSLVAVSSFGVGDMDGDGTHARSVHMESCLRQVRQIVVDEAAAVRSCECMYGEFEEKGYALTDAFGSDFEDMSRITRSCAARNGARLP